MVLVLQYTIYDGISVNLLMALGTESRERWRADKRGSGETESRGREGGQNEERKEKEGTGKRKRQGRERKEGDEQRS